MGKYLSLKFGAAGKLRKEELHFLKLKFYALDRDKSGQISVDEFKQITSIANNPLLERVIHVFDKDNNGEVDFEEFVNGIAIFAHEGYKKRKLKFLFQIYDINKDGYICHDELFDLLKLVMEKDVPDLDIHQIVHKTIWLNDKDGDQKLSFKEFYNCIESILDANLKAGIKILS
ncbi:hypothetical protein GJ496_001875 [Pomphorhynchus laevis]|nr:hypothetical protein GJ496_001875 [Pomphorhynchus laevis]